MALFSMLSTLSRLEAAQIFYQSLGASLMNCMHHAAVRAELWSGP